jgi:hypothetical protein
MRFGGLNGNSPVGPPKIFCDEAIFGESCFIIFLEIKTKHVRRPYTKFAHMYFILEVCTTLLIVPGGAAPSL